MIFKIEILEENIHLVRVYRKADDKKYFFVCTLHKAKNEKKWHILGALSTGGTGIKTTKKVFKYLKNYPSGVYTYVTKEDMARFYKRFCKKINFDDCDF